MAALGTDLAGVFSNNDALAHDLIASGKNTNEQLWHMPILDSQRYACVYVHVRVHVNV